MLNFVLLSNVTYGTSEVRWCQRGKWHRWGKGVQIEYEHEHKYVHTHIFLLWGMVTVTRLHLSYKKPSSPAVCNCVRLSWPLLFWSSNVFFFFLPPSLPACLWEFLVFWVFVKDWIFTDIVVNSGCPRGDLSLFL